MSSLLWLYYTLSAIVLYVMWKHQSVQNGTNILAQQEVKANGDLAVLNYGTNAKNRSVYCSNSMIAGRRWMILFQGRDGEGILLTQNREQKL